MYQKLYNLIQKPRLLIIKNLPLQIPLPNIQKIKPLSSSGHSNIHQISFFKQNKKTPANAEVLYGGGSHARIEPSTQRVQEYFMEKYDRKPTVDEFLNFEEPLQARIEPEAKWVEVEKNLIELVDREYFDFCRWCEENKEIILEIQNMIIQKYF